MATREAGGSNSVNRIDLPRFIGEFKFVILRVVLVVGLITAAAGGAYLFWRPASITIASLPFRPVFDGVAEGHYPNGLAFSASDITNGSIVSQAFTKNKVEDYCSLESFRSGFYVEQSSMERVFLDADYAARIADVRISPIERTRIQAEYEAKRSALPPSLALVFVKPWNCRALPKALLGKILSDVMAGWADESVNRRGVLRLDVDILTPGALDSSVANSSLLVRADLVRTGLRRLADNIRKIEAMPGASLIRLGDGRLTFYEVETRVEDLVQSGLEPLVVSAGQALGGDSKAWVAQALASARRDQVIAEGKAKSYLDALREYSGVTGSAASPRPDARLSTTGSSDVQTLSPQIDRTFIDRIVELSAPNMAFRQELTRAMVTASVDAVDRVGNANHYQQLADALSRPSPVGLTRQEVSDRLLNIVEAGKRLAKQFNDLYDEFSRVSLRADSAMFQVTGPVRVQVQQSFTFWDYALTVLASLLVALVVATAACLVWSTFRPASDATS